MRNQNRIQTLIPYLALIKNPRQSLLPSITLIIDPDHLDPIDDDTLVPERDNLGLGKQLRHRARLTHIIMIAQRRIDRHRELIKRHKRIGIAQLSGIKQVSSE